MATAGAKSAPNGNFAALLGGSADEPPPLDSKAPPSKLDRQELSHMLFGDAYDPVTKTVRTVKLVQLVEQHAAEFALRFQMKLAVAGIDPTTPVEFSIARDGSLEVSGHPEAERIRDLLKSDPALVAECRAVCGQSQHAAAAMLGAAYVRDWYAAPTDQARNGVWARYRGLMTEMSNMAGSRLVVGPTGATSLALQFVKDRGFA